MIEIDYYTVDQKAYDLTNEVGFDYTYTPPAGRAATSSCYNWHEEEDGNKTPGCIVGTILHRLGVPLEEMEQTFGSNSLIENLQRKRIIGEVNEKTRMFLRIMQVAQDAGGTWWSAYKAATNAAAYLD